MKQAPGLCWLCASPFESLERKASETKHSGLRASDVRSFQGSHEGTARVRYKGLGFRAGAFGAYDLQLVFLSLRFRV